MQAQKSEWLLTGCVGQSLRPESERRGKARGVRGLECKGTDNEEYRKDNGIGGGKMAIKGQQDRKRNCNDGVSK